MLECDDCGNLNKEGLTRCSLCGNSLVEEKMAKLQADQRKGLLVHLAGTLLMTGVLCVLPGTLFVRFVMRDDPVVGWLAWGAIWALLTTFGIFYRPRERYDADAFHHDNPLSYEDDAQRSHFALGFALLPVNIVRAHWVILYERLTGKG